MKKKIEKDNGPVTSKKRKRRRLLLKIFLPIILLLIILRLLLPSIVLKYVNKKLSHLSQYTGKVQNINIHLYRGAYVIRNISINKIDTTRKIQDTIPFFKASAIDLSLEWRMIFKGAIVGKVILEEPVINYVTGKHKNEDVEQDTSDFQDVLKSLMPLTVNRFEVDSGQIHYIDLNVNPQVDIAMKGIHIIATNLTNVVNKSELLPSRVDAEARAYGGVFTSNIRFNPLKKQPTFEMKTEFKNMSLPSINQFLKAYGNFEVEKGTFSVYAEFAGKEGNFGGYVKPFITDVKVKKNKENEAITDKIWEMAVGTAIKILKNPKTDRVATKVPINGSFSNPNINIWRAVGLILQNAFIQALKPSIDNTININKLKDDSKKTLLEKVLGSGKTDKEKKEKK